MTVSGMIVEFTDREANLMQSLLRVRYKEIEKRRQSLINKFGAAADTAKHDDTLQLLDELMGKLAS